MFLSIVIPTCNRFEALRQCLAKLAPAQQGLAADEYEIIVTDDAPDDNLQEKLRVDFPEARWIRGPRRGPAANRNAGARQARADWLVFIDDDCLPQPTLLSAYLAAIRANPGALVLEGRTVPDRPRSRMDEEAPVNETGGYLWSCNFAIERNRFFRLGGFCEDYPYACMEDVDLHERLKTEGIPVHFVAGAEVVHPWRRFGPDGRHFRVQLLSHRIFYARFPRRRQGFWPCLVHIARMWVRGLLFDFSFKRAGGTLRWLQRLLTVSAINLCLAFDSLRRADQRPQKS